MSYQEQTTINEGTGPIDSKNATKDVGATIESLPECRAFFELARSSGADRHFRRPGYITLFAPNNEAMSKAETPADANAFVLRHLALGGKTAADLRLMQDLQMLEGEALKVDRATMRIGNATLVRTDIPATNGFVHVIDGVF
jgi:uncharacterized surface protein with fasciclin (FAS1) repeats